MYKNFAFIYLCFISLVFVAGCSRKTTQPVTDSATVDSSATSMRPSIKRLSEEGKLVKELLGMDAYVFEFSGTLLVVWVEAETTIDGEESISGQHFGAAVTRRSIGNDPPESVRGKFIVSGDLIESPRLRIFFESESNAGGRTVSNPRPPLAAPWPKSGAQSGSGFQWECPSELPDFGEEFVIASINKTHVESKITDGKPDGWNVIRETTFRIKGKRLPGAPEPTANEREAVEALRKARASVFLDGFNGGYYEGDPLASAKKVRFPTLRERLDKDTLIHLKQLTKLESLDLTYTQITDDDLVHVKDLTNLQELSLGKKVTGSGLEHLNALYGLQVLAVPLESFEGLEHLSELTNLKELHISPGGYPTESIVSPPLKTVSDTGLEHLRELTNLEVLSLGVRDATLTDSVTEHIQALTNLRKLFLGPNQITDSGLQRLGDLSKLEELSLYGTHVTKSGLVHLGSLRNLEELSLSGVQITDAGLEILERLTNLQELTFKRGEISDEALTRFKRALPNCQLHLKK